MRLMDDEHCQNYPALRLLDLESDHFVHESQFCVNSQKSHKKSIAGVFKETAVPPEQRNNKISSPAFNDSFLVHNLFLNALFIPLLHRLVHYLD